MSGTARGSLAPFLDRPGPALLLLAVALLSTAGLLGLFETTETRYAEIAREMLASGDWLIPRLNGIPHFHKPPLAYWAAAAGMAGFGVNEWGARLPVALVTLLGLGLAAWTAARRFESLAVPPARVAWLLASMLLFAALSRALAADPFLGTAVLAFWALAPSPWALAALGFGFLAKGPVVLVHTALPVLVAAAWARDRRFLALLGPPRGWWWAAAIGLVWYLAVAAMTPGLLGYFLGNQIWERYATTTHGRSGPPWYFVAVLLAGTAPWTAAVLAGCVRAWRQRAHPEARLLLCWLLVPVAFLSFSGSKLPSYLLPCVPAAAILAAPVVDTRASRWGAGTMLAAIAAAGLILGGPALAGGMRPGAAALPPGLLLVCLVLAGAALLAALGRFAPAALLVVLAISLTALAAVRFESTLGSPRHVARLLSEQRARGEPVVEVGHFHAGLPFYLRERVWLLDVPRETGFGEAEGLARVQAGPDSVKAWAGRQGRVWVIGREARLRDLAETTGLRSSPVARWRKDVLAVLTPGVPGNSD